jgi:hypothetical protein
MSVISSNGPGFLDGLIKQIVPSINLEQKVKHSSMRYPLAIDLGELYSSQVLLA